jgi:hypothetical protein
MVDPEDNEEPPVVILPLRGITTTLAGARLGSKRTGTSIAASSANTHKLIMLAFFLIIVPLLTFP